MDPPALSRRIRRKFPDLTSPLTKSASRQLLSEIRRKLDLRVPRRPRTFARLVRKRTSSIKGKLSRAQWNGCAFSHTQSTPYHHSQALRRHGMAKSIGLLSPPHFTTTTARQNYHHSRRAFAITFHSTRVWTVWFRGGLVFFDFRQAGRRLRCCVEPRDPVISQLRILHPADRRDP